jgi:hypothetical protein
MALVYRGMMRFAGWKKRKLFLFLLAPSKGGQAKEAKVPLETTASGR